MRPWKVVVSRDGLLGASEVEAKLGIIVETQGKETKSEAPKSWEDHACHKCGNRMIKVFRCGKCKGVKYCGGQCEFEHEGLEIELRSSLIENLPLGTAFSGQTADWNRHKGICKALKTAMDDYDTGIAELSRTFSFLASHDETSPTNERHPLLLPPISSILASQEIDSKGLFYPALCLQSFSFTDRLALLDHSTDPTTGFPSRLAIPLDSLQPKGPFTDTPVAISSWKDYLTATGLAIPTDHPFPLLLSFPLTIWHLLAHVIPSLEHFYSSFPLNRSRVSLKSGSHITIHIPEAEQWMVELASGLMEFVLPLLRGVTVDLFLVGKEVVVEEMAKVGRAPAKAKEGKEEGKDDDGASLAEVPKPTANGAMEQQTITAPQRAMLRKGEHSVEFKSEKYESCVRVHVARTSYTYPATSSSFPVDNYPPDVVVLFGKQSMGAGTDNAQEDLRSTLRRSSLPARFIINIDNDHLSALESIRAIESIPLKGTPSKMYGPVENPFRQPWPKSRLDSDCKVEGNGVIWAWSC